MSLNRFLKFHGKSATIRNFTVDSTDSYGDDNTSSTTSSTEVIIDRNLTDTRVDVTEIGQDVRISALIYVDSEETIKDSEGTDLPTEIDLDNKTYEVLVADDLGNGYIQCLTKRV